MKIDYNELTDDELLDIKSSISFELKRRSYEPKKPVFIVDGCAYKDIIAATHALIHHIEIAKQHSGGVVDYLKDDIKNERVAFGMTFEHWPVTEYDLRPDKVYGLD